MLLSGHKRHGAEHVEPADVVVILPVLGNLDADALFLHPGQGLFIGHGPAEIIPLHFFAADIPEIAVMLLRLHALHQRMDIDVLGHLHDGGGDTLRPQIEGPEELHIQLDLVKGKLLEDIQGRIGAAEIVHPDLIPGRPEPVYDPFQLFLLISHYALGNFKVNIFMGNLVLADDPVRQVEDIAKSKIKPRQIHRNGNRGLPVGNTAPDPGAYLPEDGHVQLMDHPQLFQYGNEIVGINHAPLRVDPPGQRLKTAQLPGEGADDRLVVNLDLALFDCFFKVLLNKFFQISCHCYFSTQYQYLLFLLITRSNKFALYFNISCASTQYYN